MYPLTVTNFRYNYSTIERPGEETHWRFLHAQGVRKNDSWAVPLLRLLQYFSSSILISKLISISLIFQFVFVSYVRIYPGTFFLNSGWLSPYLISYQLFALFCSTIALVSYEIFQANFTFTIWISFLFSSLFVADF